MKHAIITAYRLPNDVRIEESSWSLGTSTWAVRRNNSCLNHDGDWEYEPMPSSRDDAFLARCRWPSAEAAYATWAQKIHQK